MRVAIAISKIVEKKVLFNFKGKPEQIDAQRAIKDCEDHVNNKDELAEVLTKVKRQLKESYLHQLFEESYRKVESMT